jgi:hypothetical protein
MKQIVEEDRRFRKKKGCNWGGGGGRRRRRRRTEGKSRMITAADCGRMHTIKKVHCRGL